MFRRFFVLIALTLAASLVLAAAVTTRWTNATTNTDGTVIPATGAGSLSKSVIEYGPCNAAQDTVMAPTTTLEVAGTATTGTIANLPPGAWCGHVKHMNSYGAESAWSDIAVKVIPAPVPNKPTGFTFG